MANRITKASIAIFVVFSAIGWVFCEELVEKDECLAFPFDLKHQQVYQEISFYLKLAAKSEKIASLAKFCSYAGFISIIGLGNKLAGFACDQIPLGRILKPLFAVFSGFCVFVYIYCSKLTGSQYCPSNLLQILLQDEFSEIVSEEAVEFIKELNFSSEILEICAFFGMIFSISAGFLIVHRTVRSQMKLLGYLALLLILCGFSSFFDMFKLYSEYRVYFMT